MNNLKHIEINIGKACNNKCRFCMSAKSELWDIKFVDIENIKEKIKSYADLGYQSIGFLGGDISIHPNIVEIISFSKQNNFININLISNGMKFDDYELSKKIIDAGTTRLNFSIHSHLSEVEDYLIQVPGGLKRKLKAINNFNLLYKEGKLRDALSINIVLNKKNYTTIVETVLFYFLKKQINDIRINFIRLNKDMKENWDDMKLSYTEFLPYLKKLIYISLKYNFRLTFDTIPACVFYKVDKLNYKKLIKKFLGEDHDHITEIDHINNNESFDWKKRKKDMLKTQFPQCEKCVYRDSCQGVRKEYGKIYGGDEFIPIITKLGNNTIIPKKQIISKPGKVKDLEYIYKKISEGKGEELKKEIITLYNSDNLNESFSNVYGVFLSKNKEYEKANEILINLIKNNKNIIEIGNIYYNIAVNYVNLGNDNKASEFLEKAKEKIGDKENFKQFYENFHSVVKTCDINEFDEKIRNYFKKNDKKAFNEYVYISNSVDNIE